jgi:hypothetical protein
VDAKKPGVQLPKPGRIKLVDALLRIHPRSHQARLPQDLEVLGDRRRRNRELSADLAGRPLTGGQEHQDSPPGRIRQGLENIHPTIMNPLLK